MERQRETRGERLRKLSFQKQWKERESDQKDWSGEPPVLLGAIPSAAGCDGKSLWQWSFPLWFWPACFRCGFQRVWLLLGGPGLFCWCFLYNSSISIKQSLYGSFLPEINRSTLSSNRTIKLGIHWTLMYQQFYSGFIIRQQKRGLQVADIVDNIV